MSHVYNNHSNAIFLFLNTIKSLVLVITLVSLKNNSKENLGKQIKASESILIYYIKINICVIQSGRQPPSVDRHRNLS